MGVGLDLTLYHWHRNFQFTFCSKFYTKKQNSVEFEMILTHFQQNQLTPTTQSPLPQSALNLNLLTHLHKSYRNYKISFFPSFLYSLICTHLSKAHPSTNIHITTSSPQFLLWEFSLRVIYYEHFGYVE